MTLSKKWLKCAGIRALKTFAQTAVSLIGVGLAFTDVDWITVISVSITASILSLLTSLAGIPEVDVEEKKDDEELDYNEDV